MSYVNEFVGLYPIIALDWIPLYTTQYRCLYLYISYWVQDKYINDNFSEYKIFMAITDTKLHPIYGKSYWGAAEITDSDRLGIRVTPKGVISFQFRSDGKGSRIALDLVAIQQEPSVKHETWLQIWDSQSTVS